MDGSFKVDKEVKSTHVLDVNIHTLKHRHNEVSVNEADSQGSHRGRFSSQWGIPLHSMSYFTVTHALPNTHAHTPWTYLRRQSEMDDETRICFRLERETTAPHEGLFVSTD